MKLYLDTSALAKRYIREPGSEAVQARCAQASEILLSPLCILEMISILGRLKEERKLSEEIYQAIKKDFFEDIKEAVFLELDQDIVREAINCIERTGLRTLDSIHVATAHQMKSDLFLTGDRAQKKAAKVMGLKTEEV